MTLGLAPVQQDLLDRPGEYCDRMVPERSVYALLHRERDQMFPDAMFADLFTARGRRSVPPSVVACVLVLQRLDGCSDREAVERFSFDLRWKWAAGVAHDYRSFVHTVLVDMRERLRRSDDPDRIFRVTCELAKQAGLVGARRVLDSTPLYDAVATQDTVTLIRSAIRGLLNVCDASHVVAVREVLSRDDDYTQAGKPTCDWNDAAEREALIDALARDGFAALGALEGHDLSDVQRQAVELLAAVLGQDLETDEHGRFRIARRVAKNRIISTVDPETRHGHKTNHRRYDGYKGHIAIDPDSEIITAADVSAANEGDGKLAPDLLADLTHSEPGTDSSVDESAVYGDCAYSSGENLDFYQEHNLLAMTKLQAPVGRGGRFAKDAFSVDLDAGSVTCPGGVSVPIRQRSGGGGIANFGSSCMSCPLVTQCTNARAGRSISISAHEALLTAQRERQHQQDWQDDYRRTRPKVERKLAHMLKAGRRLPVRGKAKARQHWRMNAAATNLKRLARLGLGHTAEGWTTQPA